MQKFTLRTSMLLSIIMLAGYGSMAQPNTIANGGTYKQNFDNVPISATATLPTGWRADVNTTVRTVASYSGVASQNHTDLIAGPNMGNPLSGGIYNFGAGSATTPTNGNGDRAIGGLNTSSNPTSVNIYFDLQNTGAGTITDFTISYSIEKYRNGKNNDGSNIDLYYSTTGAAGSWVLAPAFTRVFPADGNNDGFSTAPAAGQTRFVTSSISVSVAASAHLFLAWNISVPITATGGNASNAIALGIDDVTIRTGAAGPAGTAYYFRSATSGNWGNVNTWEYSADDITWNPAPAPHAPDLNDFTITIQSGHTVTVAASVTTDQTIVNTGGTLTVAPSQVLTLNDGTGFDLSVDGTANGTGNLLITSSAAGTASIGTSAGTISVNATVQRYVPARRAWRFLSAPVSSVGAPTINAAWQEGAGGTNANPNAGFGTHITGGTIANGFDQNSGSNSSLKVYSSASGTATDETKWTGITSTNAAITGQQGYMLFVRGDRSTNLTQLTGAPTSNTTLRENGTLRSGDQSVSLGSSVYTVVGNPYAAPIDIYNLAKTNGSTNVADNYYIWDPKMTGTYGVGAYVNVSWNPGSLSYDFVPTPTSPVSRMIQSGEAFFATTAAAGAGNIIIKESDKLASGSDNVFRVLGTSVMQNIRTNLYVVNAGGTTDLLDGTLNSYNSAFSDAIDQYDSKKLTNFGENIGIVRDGQTFIVERRQAIGDPINLKIWQMQQQNYQIQIVAESIDLTGGLTAFLYDSYLKTNTALNLSGTTTVNFSVTGDVASAAENRFTISFAKPVAAPAGNPAIVIYPNPVTNGIINLRLNNMPQGKYGVRVMNSLGQTVINRQIDHVQGSSVETLQVKGLTKGVYQLEVVKPDNNKFSSKVIAN